MSGNWRKILLPFPVILATVPALTACSYSGEQAQWRLKRMIETTCVNHKDDCTAYDEQGQVEEKF